MTATRLLAVLASAVLVVTMQHAVARAAGAAPASPDLTTFGYGNDRVGSSPVASAISPAAVPRLRTAWRTTVGGAVNTQPLVAHGVTVGGHARDLVYVGTEHGEIVALDASGGRIVWRRQLGSRRITPACSSSPDGRFGVTGTLALDRHTGRVYAVDVNGLAWALELDTGRVVPGWPVKVHVPETEFDWGALALSQGRLYVPIASLCDDGGPGGTVFHGGVVAIDVAKPAVVSSWRTTAGSSGYGGGIWGWGGVAVDDQTGDVFVGTGNSLGTASGENAGYAERVVRLSSDLHVKQSDYPLRPPFLVGDRDFGNTPVLFHAKGCPPQLVALNKTGQLFLYDRDGVSRGPSQVLTVAGTNGIALYGMPAFDSASRTLLVLSPTSPPSGVLRTGVQAFALTDRCRLALRWQQTHDEPPVLGSPPTIAGGVIYIGSGRNGWLRAFRLADGVRVWSMNISTTLKAAEAATEGTFAAPAVIDGTLFAGTWGGQVWAFRVGATGAAPAKSPWLLWLLIAGASVALLFVAVVRTRRRRDRRSEKLAMPPSAAP